MRAFLLVNNKSRRREGEGEGEGEDNNGMSSIIVQSSSICWKEYITMRVDRVTGVMRIKDNAAIPNPRVIKVAKMIKIARFLS